MKNKKIAAIVPALNEEANVERVLRVLLSSKDINQVILVDDGSTDKTAEVAGKAGAEVIKLPENGGKGNAMLQGVKHTNADIIVFFDADLTGLSDSHISLLIEPILKDNFEMCVGIRDRYWGLPKLIARIDPLLAISGERAIKRELIGEISDKFIQGFTIETSLNYYCATKKIPVKHTLLKNLNAIIKERKWGFKKGFISRLKMIADIIKIRLALLVDKRFKN